MLNAVVFDLATYRTKKESAANTQNMLTGEAECLMCHHVWHPTTHIGSTWLECPECASHKGRFTHPVIHDEDHFTCECGNNLLHVTASKYYCPNCGNNWPL